MNRIPRDLSDLFPFDYSKELLPSFLKKLFTQLMKTTPSKNTRVGGVWGKEAYQSLVKKYSVITVTGEAPLRTCKSIVRDLFAGIPRWSSPNLQYNVGAAVNTAAAAIYSLALNENIYLINDGLAGNALVAEQAVTNILGTLAAIANPYGIFSFGGTATNLYAIRIGNRKAAPESGVKGLPTGIKILVTEEAHFSHATSVDWLGIGTDNILTIDADAERRSLLADAEQKMRTIFQHGEKLSTIIINGGTTYSHMIDDIAGFVRLRDRLAKEFNLNYLPHIHVDSVIGWVWLFYKEYDFKKNPYNIEPETLRLIKEQLNRISDICLADSWGVDFHKGVGSCPVDCSIFMLNDKKDILHLTKKKGAKIELHQLAKEFSTVSPVDFTLETSRAGGAPLAALATLHTFGMEGYRKLLANVIEVTIYMRRLFKAYDDIEVCNDYSPGYDTLIRLYPPELVRERDSQNPGTIQKVNAYMKAFYEWDLKNRILKNRGVEYSFSSAFLELKDGSKISALKLYPVSPHFTEKYARNAVELIVKQKHTFDKTVREQHG